MHNAAGILAQEQDKDMEDEETAAKLSTKKGAHRTKQTIAVPEHM